MSRLAIDPLQGLTTFTPTWVNVTVGSSANTGWYVRLGGRWIVFEVKLVTAASFAITGNVAVNLPVTALTAPNPAQFTGRAYQVSASRYPLLGWAIGSTTVSPELAVWVTNTNQVSGAALSATVPFTWATSGDTLIVHGKYLAADAT